MFRSAIFVSGFNLSKPLNMLLTTFISSCNWARISSGRASDQELALFWWSGRTTEITIHHILFKLRQSMKLHIMTYRRELQTEIPKIKNVNELLVTHDLDSTLEELRPWNSHFYKCPFKLEKYILLTKQHKSMNLRIRNIKYLATWYLLEYVLVLYKSFWRATSQTEKWRSATHFPQ